MQEVSICRGSLLRFFGCTSFVHIKLDTLGWWPIFDCFTCKWLNFNTHSLSWLQSVSNIIIIYKKINSSTPKSTIVSANSGLPPLSEDFCYTETICPLYVIRVLQACLPPVWSKNWREMWQWYWRSPSGCFTWGVEAYLEALTCINLSRWLG